jgi:hypothetical protein
MSLSEAKSLFSLPRSGIKKQLSDPKGRFPFCLPRSEAERPGVFKSFAQGLGGSIKKSI